MMTQMLAMMMMILIIIDVDVDFDVDVDDGDDCDGGDDGDGGDAGDDGDCGDDTIFSMCLATIPWSLKSHPSLRHRGVPEARNRGVPEARYGGLHGASAHLSFKWPSHRCGCGRFSGEMRAGGIRPYGREHVAKSGCDF